MKMKRRAYTARKKPGNSLKGNRKKLLGKREKSNQENRKKCNAENKVKVYE